MVGQLVGFFIMLMVGYGCVRLRFYGQTALDGMCSLLLNVLIPLLVFSNAMAGAEPSLINISPATRRNPHSYAVFFLSKKKTGCCTPGVPPV